MIFLLRFSAVAGIVCIGVTFALGAGDAKKPKEIKRWGTVTDPDGDCTFKEDKGKLTITVPAGFHDLHPNRAMNAARVLREVDGDFTATVKVTCALTPGQSSIKGKTAGYFAGLLLWVGDKEYIRFERNAMRSVGDKFVSFTPLFEYWKNGGINPGQFVGRFDSFRGDATWFKLERKGGTVTAHCSHDGKEWVATRVVDTELPKKLRIGVAALNTSDVPFVADFTELKIEANK